MKLKDGKAAGKDEVTGEMIEGILVDRVCRMTGVLTDEEQGVLALGMNL